MIDTLTAYGMVYIFGRIYTQRDVHFPPSLAPPSVMAPVHFKPLLDACFREDTVLLIFPFL